MPTVRKDQQTLNAQAQEAAQWMCDQMRRHKGTLTQEIAWKGLRELFGDTFARHDEQGGQWLSKAVLGAFRKLTPNVMWDPAGNRWVERQSADTDGARML
jgi:hypothetical protein